MPRLIEITNELDRVLAAENAWIKALKREQLWDGLFWGTVIGYHVRDLMLLQHVTRHPGLLAALSWALAISALCVVSILTSRACRRARREFEDARAVMADAVAARPVPEERIH